MKKSIFISLALCLTLLTHAKTINVTYTYFGSSLNKALTKAERDTITSLTVTGTINAADFMIMRDSMPALKTVDLGAAGIEGYDGMFGTNYNIPGQNNSSIQDTSYVDGIVPKHAFQNNKTITLVILPQSATSMDEQVFVGCSALQTATLPPNITSLPAYTFANASSLISISIPPSTTSIGGSAFYNSLSLSSITIPANVTSIGNYAFDGCTGLSSIICKRNNPVDLSSTQYPFDGVDKNNCILYVPKGRISYYNATTAFEWKDFYNKEEDPTSGINNSLLDKVSISTQADGVQVSGLPYGEKLNVYTAQGLLLNSQTTTNTGISCSLPTHGVYILQVGRASRKFVY